MRWESFLEACPEIAGPAEQRFRNNQLVMLGTLRGDGSPRISPTELDFAAGRLMIGMMWRSPKALDLQRDPRTVVHSVTADKSGSDGDFKIYGRALEVSDADTRDAFRQAIKARIDWAPDEPSYHLFEIEVTSAGFVLFRDGKETVMVWDPEAGFRQWQKDG